MAACDPSKVNLLPFFVVSFRTKKRLKPKNFTFLRGKLKDKGTSFFGPGHFKESGEITLDERLGSVFLFVNSFFV